MWKSLGPLCAATTETHFKQDIWVFYLHLTFLITLLRLQQDTLMDILPYLKQIFTIFMFT